MTAQDAAGPVAIDVRGIAKTFGGAGAPAVADVSLYVPGGRLTALLGPSGSGKTTMLRILAGLEIPDAGIVRFGDTDVTHRPARTRGAGLVFQQYALFRHMTVFENIAFPLRVRHWPRSEARARVEELLALVRLDGFGPRRVSSLSGGQAQRVALARALAPRPSVLLLDEPFGALDAQVRSELRRWLRRLHDQLHVTSVLVTHDREEASEVADEVVVLHHGRVQQAGVPAHVAANPATQFVEEFFAGARIHSPSIPLYAAS